MIVIVVVRLFQPVGGFEGCNSLLQFFKQFGTFLAEFFGERLSTLLSQVIPQFDKLLELVLGRGVFIAHDSAPCGGSSGQNTIAV